MAHQVETMAYAGEIPWHGLGKEVPADLSPDQMLKAAGLDWQVNKLPAYVKVGDEELMTGKSALVRSTDNSVLDVVSNDWNPVQNSTAFEFFNDFVYEGDMEMHTAGSLKNGQIVWALAKVKDSFELFGGDRVDSYLMFTNPHKFGQSIDVRFTPIRVVCNNTLTLALNQKDKNRVRCTHASVFDPEAVKTTLGIASDQLRVYKNMAKFLGSKKAKLDKVNEYFKEVFPVTNQWGKDSAIKEQSKNAKWALDVLEKQPGAEFAKGSWWQAFNAVTYLVDHELGRTTEKRLTSAWFGPNKQLKIKALEKAIDYAEAA